MNLLARLFHRSQPAPHVVVRHVVATAEDNSKAAAKRRERRAKLEAQVAHLTPEQRAAARVMAGRG